MKSTSSSAWTAVNRGELGALPDLPANHHHGVKSIGRVRERSWQDDPLVQQRAPKRAEALEHPRLNDSGRYAKLLGQLADRLAEVSADHDEPLVRGELPEGVGDEP